MDTTAATLSVSPSGLDTGPSSAAPPAPTRARPPRRGSGRARGLPAASGVVLVCALLSVVFAPTVAALPEAARSVASAGVPWSWPTPTPVPVLRRFDPPEQRWRAGHRGVDLDVDVGSEVLAPADGVVTWAGTVVDRGVVSVQHGPVRSTFEPVEALVTRGQHVVRGQVLGRVVEGHTPGALHWGARVAADTYVDPLRMLVGSVVLKPWG